jgi:hypothetical protein
MIFPGGFAVMVAYSVRYFSHPDLNFGKARDV